MHGNPDDQISQRVNNLFYRRLQTLRDKRWLPVAFGYIVVACFSSLADLLPPVAEVAIVSVMHIGLCILSLVSFVFMITILAEFALRVSWSLSLVSLAAIAVAIASFFSIYITALAFLPCFVASFAKAGVQRTWWGKIADGTATSVICSVTFLMIYVVRFGYTDYLIGRVGPGFVPGPAIVLLLPVTVVIAGIPIGVLAAVLELLLSQSPTDSHGHSPDSET